MDQAQDTPSELSTPASEQHQQLNRYLGFLKYDANNVNLWLDCLKLAIDLQAWEQAKRLAEAPPQDALQLADANGLIGQVFLTFGQYQAALDTLTKAVGLGIQQPAVMINIAFCHFYLHQFASALEILNTNKSLEEAFPRDYLLLSARLQHHLNGSDTAIALLEKLHAISPPDSESAGLLSLLLFEADRDYDKAMHLANTALQLNPYAIEALLARTSLHMDASDYDFAEADIRTATEKYPQNGRAFSSLALLEFNNFHFDKAKEAAEQAVIYMPDHIGTWHLLAWSYLTLNQLPEALNAFEKSYDIDPRFAETHGGLASVYALMGETKLAQNHIKLAERLDPNSFALVYAKMVLSNSNNQPDTAKEIFENLLSRANPKSGKTPRDLMNKRLSELAQKNNQPKSLH